MNDELKAKLTAYLTKLESAAGKVEDFASAEVPEAVREWLRWELIDAVSLSLLFAVVGSAMLYAVYRLMCQEVDRSERRARLDSSDEAMSAICCALLLVLGVCAICVALYNARAAAKVYFAPRVVVIEKVSELLRHSSGKP